MYTEHTHTQTQGDVNCLLQVHHLHFLQHTSRVCVHVCASVCVCVCIRLAHLVHTRPLSHNNIAVTQCQRYDKSTCTFFPPSTRASPYTHTYIYIHYCLHSSTSLSVSSRPPGLTGASAEKTCSTICEDALQRVLSQVVMFR